MTTQSTPLSKWQSAPFPSIALNLAAKFWFATVLVGQVIFSYYIVALYYTATLSNDTARFNTVMPAGHIEGDYWGNIAVIGHVLLAAVITLGGLLQLLPVIRSKVPALHRWNGRLYVLTAVIMSLSGAFMIITRHEKVVGDLVGHVTLMLNGAIILTCAALAFRFARQRKFANHRRWALRLFVAVSGVWFFRVGMMAWLSIHGKPVGFDPLSFSGPFLTVLYLTVYIMPILFLECYFRAQTTGSAIQKLATATTIVMLCLIMMLGIFGATMGMWLPRI
ncbi:membrane protein [Arenicella chitinivorans]|uniref:Membrane protein n=1 Tax=Arenicella chitinivorans TaxID=1329800 RepID=A0A918RKA7_9GAMM|nr:DUF2306 domain-containing protein [Arenicella chitinivorans]GHA03236.1 membrane protein [Arenicella chitinivorans]